MFCFDVTGGYVSAEASVWLQTCVTTLCAELLPDAVALVDAVAPADFALGSVLGSSDGRVYERMHREFTRRSDWNQPPSWWPLLVKEAKAHL